MNWNEINGRFPREISRVFQKHGIKARPTGKNLLLAVASKENFAGDLYDEIHPFSSLNGNDERKAGFINDLKNAAYAIAGLTQLIKGKKRNEPVEKNNAKSEKTELFTYKNGMIAGVVIIIILGIILYYFRKK